MKLAEYYLKSTSAYSQSKYYHVEKESRELSGAYEERTWRNRCHTTDKGQIFIPPMAFANSLKEAAKYLNEQIPGKGKQTFTKNFEAGVMVVDPLYLPLLAKEVESIRLFVPSDGVRGSGKRVEKIFPLIRSWEGQVTFYIYDDIITQDIFEKVLTISGSLIGIGFFRPRNRGYYGRFTFDGNKTNWLENV